MWTHDNGSDTGWVQLSSTPSKQEATQCCYGIGITLSPAPPDRILERSPIKTKMGHTEYFRIAHLLFLGGVHNRLVPCYLSLVSVKHLCPNKYLTHLHPHP
jgi:hypothetical protein